MTLPNLLIIGVAKSGTTSLYMYLKQHPEIFMSPVKEPHFFSYDDRSKMTKGPGDTIPKSITDFDSYKNLFKDINAQKVIGECSPTYIYRKEAPARIHELIPNVKLIAILRNPAERAFSAFMHLLRDHRETTENFSEALELEELRIKQGWGPIWHYKRAGLYFEQLINYYSLFDRDQIKIILYEELNQDPKSVLKEIFEFLDIETNFIPNISIRYNVSGSPKSETLQTLYENLFNSPNPIKSISRKIIPEQWRWKVTTCLRNRNLERENIPSSLRKELLGFFQDDILNLQKLIGKDLSNWLRV